MVKQSPEPAGHSATQEIDPEDEGTALFWNSVSNSPDNTAAHPSTTVRTSSVDDGWRLISHSNALCGRLNLRYVSCIHDFYANQETGTKTLSIGRKHLPQAGYVIREGYLCAIVWWQASTNL